MPTKQKRTKRMPADNLVRTSKTSAIELKEDELNRVTGGGGPGENVSAAFGRVGTEPSKQD